MGQWGGVLGGDGGGDVEVQSLFGQCPNVGSNNFYGSSLKELLFRSVARSSPPNHALPTMVVVMVMSLETPLNF